MLLAMASFAAVSCASESSGVPPGFSCEHHPFGESPLDFLQPDPEELGEFDLLARVRINGHEVGETAGGLVSFATIEDHVSGRCFRRGLTSNCTANSAFASRLAMTTT